MIKKYLWNSIEHKKAPVRGWIGISESVDGASVFRIYRIEVGL